MQPFSPHPPSRLGYLLLASALASFSASCARAQGEADGSFPSLETRRAAAWPVSEVARVESDTLFSTITGIDVDSRGRVYVADWFAARVTVLDAEGRILRTLGRKGLGPGEFRGIRGVQVLSGDSVLVYDPGAARLSVFPPDAEKPSYTVNLGAALGGPKPFTLRRAAADGAYVALIRPQFTPDAATPRRDEIRVLNADGTPRGAALRNFPSQSFLRVNQRGGGYSVMPNPFGRQAFVAAGADDRIHVVWSDSLAVETVDVAGRRVGGFSIRHSPPRVTEADVSDAVRQLPPRMAAIFRPVLADSVPERWPAVRGLVADDQGRLWLGLFASSAEPAEWAAFDAGGHYEGSVFLPSDVEVMAVRGGKLYGVAPTEAGAPQVVVLRLAAQSAGGGD